ncbi:MAG: SOS response-associated peptidase [Hydrogenophilales bacterium]|nr:SOS response-associated peptidase [Hydrogenophilales bacterium]
MCGRFAQTSSLTQIATRFGVAEAGIQAQEGPPRYNLAPGAQVLGIRQADSGRELVRLKWGLVPHWSVEAKTGYSTSNARAETVDSKPAFRTAFKRRRCLIPANGWYEWAFVADQKWKQPWYYQGVDSDLLAFAGLWERWEQRDKVLESCTVIVCAANAVASPVHDRMPVILPEADWASWLDPETPAEQANGLLQTCPSEWITTRPVSRAVSLAKNEGPELIVPISL